MEDIVIAIIVIIAGFYSICRFLAPLSMTRTSKPGVAIVTGSNTGIGFETASELARRGFDVILACRNESKGRNAAKRINEVNMSRNARFMKLDLSSSTSIVEFVKSLKTAPQVLVTMGLNSFRPDTEDGFEIHFGVNYFCHFFLTTLILDRFYENDDREFRVVNLSSVTHGKGIVIFEHYPHVETRIRVRNSP